MANQKIIAKKQEVVEEIKKTALDNNAFVLYEYQGLSVAEMTTLRKKLREVGADTKIYKNTLTKRALDSMNIDLGDELNGPKAVAFGEDSVAPIKILSDFAKEHEALELKAGIVEGKVAGLEDLKRYAAIPSRDMLLTMLAAGLMGTVRDLSICLDLYSKEKENN